MATIMTREHPQWDQFIQILEGAVYFHEVDMPGEGEPQIYCQCKGDLTRSVATLAFMTALGIVDDIDVDGTVQYFEANGGYCDCEVLFNVDCDDEEEFDEEDAGDDDELSAEYLQHRDLPTHVLSEGTFVDGAGDGTFEIVMDSRYGVHVTLQPADDPTTTTYHFMSNELTIAILEMVNRYHPGTFKEQKLEEDHD